MTSGATRLPRKARAAATLRDPSAPRVFSPSRLTCWLDSQGLALPPRSLTQALAEWSSTGLIQRLHGQAYINHQAHPRPTVDEATPWLRPGALVSLHRVLGQRGILNNPSQVVQAVVPIGRTRKVGDVVLAGQPFSFAALPDSWFVPVGHRLYSDCVEMFAPFQATPEKALLDWLHLVNTPAGAGRWPLPPDHDWDLDDLDTDRMGRLAAHFHMMDAWLGFKQRLDNDCVPMAVHRQRQRRPL